MAVISVPKPHQIGDLGQQDERRKLYTYLYQLSEKVEAAMQNIDTENMSSAYNKQLSEMSSVTDKAKQLAVMLDKNEIAETEKVRQQYKALRTSLLSRVDNVTVYVDNLVAETTDGIMTKVSKEYIASDPEMSLTDIISAAVELSAEDLRAEFTTTANITAGPLQEEIIELKTYIKFDEDGITIGKNTSPIRTKLTNQRLEFVTGANGDVVLAYVQNDKLHIDTAEVDTIAIGNSNDGYVDIDMQLSGLFVKWRAK